MAFSIRRQVCSAICLKAQAVDLWHPWHQKTWSQVGKIMEPPMTGNDLYIYTTYKNGDLGDRL